MASGVYQLEWIEGRSYFAHVDPSGGGVDSFALAIGHIEDGVGVLDCLLERRGTGLSPEGTVAEYCDVLKSYRVSSVVGDAYSAEFVREQFRKNGVSYTLSDRSTGEYFAGFLRAYFEQPQGSIAR